jgi:predicted transcriptional regulator
LVVRQALGILEDAGIQNPARLIAPVVRSAVETALSQPVSKIDPKDAL